MSTITIIIPAHNEERRLGRTLERLTAWALSRIPPAEIVVVESGSTDATGAIADSYAARHASVRVIHAPLGKGRAVAAGVAAASSEILYMCDVDLSTPIEEADRLLQPVIRKECDIAIGSREGEAARRIGEPAYRHVMGRVFNRFVQLVALRGIRDSQCGFKCFRAAVARRLFAQLTITGFAFDVEVLFLARRNGFRVCEIPVTWTFDSDTRVRPVRDAFIMFADVLRVRLKSMLGRYVTRA